MSAFSAHTTLGIYRRSCPNDTILGNSFLQAYYCASSCYESATSGLCLNESISIYQSICQGIQCPSSSLNKGCYGVCPNPDIAGIGVRVAFYAQSLVNALIVIFSPDDAASSAWASTLLTGSLVIAAIAQKAQQPPTITLHHATLVFNYATLSCISSLAIAPLLPVWRSTVSEHHPPDHNHTGDDIAIGGTSTLDIPGVYTRARQMRQRIIISVALLLQVSLQWTWALIMFLSPAYQQTVCSGATALIFFFGQFSADEINDDKYYVWVLWLIFGLGATLFLTVVLAVSGQSRAYSDSLHSSRSSSSSRSQPPLKELFDAIRTSIKLLRQRRHQLILLVNLVSLGIWVSYILMSEIQTWANCIFPGENDFGTFGQITALILALAPVWVLVAAVPKVWRRVRRALRTYRRTRESISNSPAAIGRPDSMAIELDPPNSLHHSVGDVRERLRRGRTTPAGPRAIPIHKSTPVCTALKPDNTVKELTRTAVGTTGTP
ncbi:hypothetical protein WOLCODRAFT_16544 [Wolfiporia cocos MD-104 SS10]|uniref:Uncharacterized protein n=1 Tax=Wolfiporia cocos (strain MD-104) TaxID=742152 RepID=A0A2H3JRR7_WOLCO|nr:hypothetical protein WOLCODRAFT_16544 [Wolfiporia cocos MD-104 SS10]